MTHLLKQGQRKYFVLRIRKHIEEAFIDIRKNQVLPLPKYVWKSKPLCLTAKKNHVENKDFEKKPKYVWKSKTLCLAEKKSRRK